MRPPCPMATLPPQRRSSRRLSDKRVDGGVGASRVDPECRLGSGITEALLLLVCVGCQRAGSRLEPRLVHRGAAHPHGVYAWAARIVYDARLAPRIRTSVVPSRH